MNNLSSTLLDVAMRIKEMREILGISVDDMAKMTDTTPEEYSQYEAGTVDFPFTFIHKCALAFDIDLTDLLEGHSAHLSSYTVPRKGHGRYTAKEDGIEIKNLAPMFRGTGYDKAQRTQADFGSNLYIIEEEPG